MSGFFIRYFTKGISFQIIMACFFLRKWDNPEFITAEIIRKRIRFARKLCTQTAISLPKIKRNIDLLRRGSIPPPIEIAGDLIIEGHHRYVAGILFGVEPPSRPTHKTSATTERYWRFIKIDPADWDHPTPLN